MCLLFKKLHVKHLEGVSKYEHLALILVQFAHHGTVTAFDLLLLDALAVVVAGVHVLEVDPSKLVLFRLVEHQWEEILVKRRDGH